jgi:branched-subunit amino acid transport protein
MMNTLLAIILMALMTYLVRVLPMLLFKKPIESIFIKSFLHYIPYAILLAMTVPYIFYATTHIASSLVGTLVAVVLAWHNKSLITVSVVAVLCAYIVELLI